MKPSILFILIISLSVPAYSQVELQENVRYEGNTKLVIPSLGIALTVPEGWFGGIATGSPYMVLADASNEVTIIISADEMKESEVFGEMQRQISLDETISISPIGLVQKEGKRWWGNYTINGATQEMKCYVEVKLGDYPRRQSAVWRPAFRRNGGLGPRGLWSLLYAAGDAHGQVRRHQWAHQGVRKHCQGRSQD